MAKFGFGLRKKAAPMGAAPADIDAPIAASTSTVLEQPQPYLHLMRQVKSQPQALAAVTGLQGQQTELTFRQLFEQSKKIAAVLREAGVKPGQFVATAVPVAQNLPFMAALLHEATIGAVAPATAFDANLNKMVDWVIATQYLKGFPQERTILVDAAFNRQVSAATTVIDPQVYPSMDSVCRVVFSSGTTGTPKAIPFAIGMLEARNEYSRNAWMSVAPFMSLIGLPAITGFQTAYATLVTGQTYFTPGDGQHNLAMIHKYQIASFKASPAQLAELLPQVQKSPQLAGSLKVAQTAGSFLPNELARAFQQATGCQVINLYGATEVGLIARRPDITDDATELGPLVDGAFVEIVDAKNNVLPQGETGTIRWRRQYMATEYFQNPQATAKSFIDGWFYPGDTGYLGTDGHLHLVGRNSELINAGGVKLNPSVIDEFVKRYPKVADAAAFSYVGDLGVEAFAIAVVVIADFNRQGLLDAFKQHFGGLAPSVIIAVPKIKRNEMRKVMRAEMAKDLEAILAKQR
mgnify:CR=1 FL=1